MEWKGRLGIARGLGRAVGGLVCDRDDALPGASVGRHGSRGGGGELGYGDHDGAVVDEADGEAGVSGHGAVGGGVGEGHAEVGVRGVGRDGADHVGWVDVLECGFLPLRVEMVLDPGAEPLADGRELAVPAGIGEGGHPEEVLAGALGDDDDCVSLAIDDALEVTEDGDEVDRDLGDEAEVDVLRGERRVGGEVAGAASHELDDADAARVVADGLDAGRRDGADGLGDGGHEAE
mmetsp:Transcript_1022/g.3004  ORF Transcript_1022/g.3004 Transcript_1022/m.3004 type:complete len:234 (+) Transcript_1022:369-1070(+)